MSTPCVAPASEEWIERFGLTANAVSSVYKASGIPRHSDFVFAAEVWDFFMVEALTHIKGGDMDSRVSNALRLDQWQFDILNRLGSGSSSGAPLMSEGGRIMALVSIGFVCWLSRIPDGVLREYGAELLVEMLRSGETEPIYAPQSPGSFTDDDYVSVPIATNGKYTDRLIQAWGDDDIRVLDFYRVGITDRAFIDRCVAEGIDSDLAMTVASDFASPNTSS